MFLTEAWVKSNVPGYTEETIKQKVQIAPPFHKVEDDRKFTDLNGNPVNIRIRKDTNNNYYFSVADVKKWLNVKKLSSYLTSRGYIQGEDYEYFIPSSASGGGTCRNKKVLYFTYAGLTNYLYSSKSPVARRFVRWANDILFTHQFGTTEEKQELASTLIGAPVSDIRRALSTESGAIACVYLFTLGKAANLKLSGVPDDYIVCKYGKTNNLDRRIREHATTYGKIKGVNLCLMFQARVDEQQISDAEADIKAMFQMGNHFIEYKNHSELVAVPMKLLKTNVMKRFAGLTRTYGGAMKDLIHELESKNSEIEIMKLRHLNEVQELRHEKEVIELKLQISEMKNNNVTARKR